MNLQPPHAGRLSPEVIEHRLRTFLLGLVAFLCVGTIAELWMAKHYNEPLQLVPFIICAVSLVVVVAVLARPNRVTIWALRLVMLGAGAGSLLGVWEHLQANYGFAVEIRPNAPFSETLIKTLQGASPLLAPGILALAAVLALAATYYHPALRKVTAPTAEAVTAPASQSKISPTQF
jgi:hypothetical protein